MLNLYKLRIAISILLLSFTAIVNAQLKDNFIKGTIVLQNDQKLEGWIKNDVTSALNYKIHFKETPETKNIIAYDTSQINSVTLENGEIYKLIRYKSHYNADSVYVLGKLLIKGKASLYKITYNSDDIFVVTNNGKNYALQNDKVDPGTTSTETTLFFYKDYLAKALSDFPSEFEKINNSSFSDQNIIRIISDYNRSMNSENTLVVTKSKSTHFIIAGVGGMVKSSTDNEAYVQAIYRTYLPRISKSTSINVGLNYFSNHYGYNPNPSYIYSKERKYSRTLLSLPLQIQQNLLNKFLRPYVTAGFDVSYYDIKNQEGVSILQHGVQSNFGLGILYAVGIEADIFKGLMLKGEYRDEVFSHLAMVGIGYNFSKK
jgi:hypothetical protein